jgi:hypothetical protein
MSSRTVVTIIVVMIVVMIILWSTQSKSRRREPVEGRSWPACSNKFCYRALHDFDTQFGTLDPVQITYSLIYPGGNDVRKVPNIASYTTAQISAETSDYLKLITAANPSGIYSCWCFDVFDHINAGQNYTCNAISMLARHAIDELETTYSCEPSNPLYTTYLAGILFLMNEAQSYEAQGYSSNDIQTAMWTLLFTANPTTATPVNDGLGYNAGNVANLIAAAMAAQLAYNIDGNACKHILTTKIAGLLTLNNSPITSSTGCDQVMCIAIPLYELENCCE